MVRLVLDGFVGVPPNCVLVVWLNNSLYVQRVGGLLFPLHLQNVELVQLIDKTFFIEICLRKGLMSIYISNPFFLGIGMFRTIILEMT